MPPISKIVDLEINFPISKEKRQRAKDDNSQDLLFACQSSESKKKLLLIYVLENSIDEENIAAYSANIPESQFQQYINNFYAGTLNILPQINNQSHKFIYAGQISIKKRANLFWVTSISVEDNYIRRGIGTKLVKLAEKHFSSNWRIAALRVHGDQIGIALGNEGEILFTKLVYRGILNPNRIVLAKDLPRQIVTDNKNSQSQSDSFESQQSTESQITTSRGYSPAFDLERITLYVQRYPGFTKLEPNQKPPLEEIIQPQKRKHDTNQGTNPRKKQKQK